MSNVTPAALKSLSAENTPYQDKIQSLKAKNNGAAEKKEQLMADRDAYLQLLIAQLKNQNPQEPTDTTAMTQQIIAISQAEQTIQTNENLEKLLSLQQQNHRMNAVNLIGKNIEYDQAVINLVHGDKNNLPTIRYDLPQNADNLAIKILDEKGEIVRTMHISSQEQAELRKIGMHSINWDGRNDLGHLLPEKEYYLKIEASKNIYDKEKENTIIGSEAISVSTSSHAEVMGVIEDQGEIQLLLNNGKSLPESKARIYSQIQL